MAHRTNKLGMDPIESAILLHISECEEPVVGIAAACIRRCPGMERDMLLARMIECLSALKDKGRIVVFVFGEAVTGRGEHFLTEAEWPQSLHAAVSRFIWNDERGWWEDPTLRDQPRYIEIGLSQAGRQHLARHQAG